jgi:sulfur-oxidizing protein SoxX
MSYPHALAIAAIGVAFAVTVQAGTARAEDLVPFKVADGAIARSLTGKPGDPANGRKVVAGTKLGNCLSCHEIPIAGEDFQGEVGPNLAGVADRLSEGQMRLRLVDAKQVNPDTLMPAFYRTRGLTQVAKDFAGKPILTAQQVEDVIAYLRTLK